MRRRELMLTCPQTGPRAVSAEHNSLLDGTLPEFPHPDSVTASQSRRKRKARMLASLRKDRLIRTSPRRSVRRRTTMACESAEIAESSQNPSNTFLPASNNEGSAPPSSHIPPPSAGHRRKLALIVADDNKAAIARRNSSHDSTS
ncbi:uncharacterized protein LOC120669815 isoform X2 [Panicum virgatum]|uniref:uncharacterized protein LOC120669815 isoform X2 n=1 Tax=Panicum virgatum TaxID=38727 RepID=UPI0019D5DA7D|nr:uncharacterized protein LOC120669815 isoform X2 [Panicum virgatum]